MLTEPTVPASSSVRRPVVPRPPAREGERGTITVVAAGLVAVLLLAAVIAVDVGMLSVARSRAQTAADLAALAAVTPGKAPPDRIAADLAKANGARVTVCDCDAGEATVTVAVPVRLLPAGQVDVPARARAVRPVNQLAAMGAATAAPPADVDALLRHPGLELTPQARSDMAAGRVDSRVVQLLGLILQDHDIAISVLRSGHSKYVAGTSRVSKHYRGLAMDIWKVDGAPVRAGHAPSFALAARLGTLQGPLRPGEIGSPFTQLVGRPGYFTDAGHQRHIHVGMG